MTSFGTRLLKSVAEARAIASGQADPAAYRVTAPADLNVKAIRKTLGLTQREFAHRFGFSPARVRDWEQGRSRPDSAIRAYLIVIQRDHEAVERALAPERTPAAA